MSSCSCNGDSYAILLFWSPKWLLQDTAEVKEAKARFGDAFADAEVDVILDNTKIPFQNQHIISIFHIC